MIATALAVSLLAAAPAKKLAVPGFSGVNLDEKVAAFYTEHTAQQLKLEGLDVATQREIQSLLGLERQKALLGCSEQAGSCLAELANALGADGVVLGDIARFGSTWQVNLKIIAAVDGRTLSLFSDTASSEEAVLGVLTRGAQQLARSLSGEPPHSGGPSLRKLAIVPLAIGVIGLGVGAACLTVSEQSYQRLATGMPAPGADGASIKSTGRLMGMVAIAGFVTAGVGLAAATLLWVLGREPQASVTVAPVAGGGVSIGFVGVLP